ncbi:YeeE/YedE family protein [Pedobacter ginsenosidimutans]|uniref:YeeE/YedE family protein n=1 Tax=Pedobacter ginsenosidimutans TaxID=687842 RepID=A0A0T5VVL5_9SPHI|nr:YeeE/YedE thiosulfate transporter family protein [Pedobacter ginsenosidimutans]KRT17864.1 YeeE/YedE family protein [Pedobacter ginsenosidimutans]
MNWIFEPWPWYIAGPLITLTMFSLLYLGKNFGLSSNLRTICTIAGADKSCDFFCFNWKSQYWNLLVMLGAIIGGYIASHYLSKNQIPTLNPKTIENLHSLGFESAGKSYAPQEMFGNNAISSPGVFAILLIGGLLIGFGSRYAGGCTSGHSISGLSNLQLPSLIATIGFFTGGLIMIHFIMPMIF